MAAHRMPQVLADRYQLDRLVGVGGMAQVLAAHDRRLDRIVAVKILRPDIALDDRVRRRFLHEAQIAARFSHVNAVTVYDAGEADHRLFIVMELVDGRTVADELAVGGPLQPVRAVRITRQVLGALEAAHAQGLIHRDIKTSNVLLPWDGEAKLADFGLAGRLRMQSTLDGGRLLGTPGYLSPEQVAGHEATPRSDVYAMGVTLYAMLAGAPPFSGSSAWERATAHRRSRPRPLLDVRPELDEALVDIVDTAMALDPLERYADAQEMAAALRVRSLATPRGPRAGRPTPRSRPPSSLPSERQPRFWRWQGRLVRVLLGVTAVAAAVAAAAGLR